MNRSTWETLVTFVLMAVAVVVAYELATLTYGWLI
jgi:hypothetical protein